LATFDATLHIQAFESMERGLKTVYTVIANDEYSMISSGDRLEFGSYGSITVGTVRRYPDLESLATAEGWRNVVPEAETEERAISLIRGTDSWEETEERQRGVMALRVRETRRK
jgi:ASC-1-like (ASCH) protein